MLRTNAIYRNRVSFNLYPQTLSSLSYLWILVQKVFVQIVAAEFSLEGLVYKEPSVLAYAIQLIEPIFRNMDEFKFVAVISGRTGVDWKKES